MTSPKRVAVITGAGRNIGRSTALALAEVEIEPVLVDLNPEALDEVETAIAARAPGVRVAKEVCDVSSSSDVAALAQRIEARFGRADILVNNVAVTDRGATVLDLDDDEWDRVLNLSLRSVFLCSKHIGRLIVAGGAGGVIINLGSSSGYVGRANAIAYPTAKSALLGMTRSMAIQLAPHGVRVNLVAPSKAGSPVGQDERPEDRGITNLVGRSAEPEDIANVVRFLVSEDASFVDGVDLLVDGGAVIASGV